MPYTATPANLCEINEYIIEYGDNVAEEIVRSPKCFILDTCSVQFYMNNNRSGSLGKYILKKQGCVVLFRTILMEMAGEKGELDENQICFIRGLSRLGIKVFLLFEEDIFKIMQIYTDNSEINSFLKYAILCVMGSTSLLDFVLSKQYKIVKYLNSEALGTVSDFYKEFWTTFRACKKSKDNMGELACIICIHIMANMEDINQAKYMFLTEDKPAVAILSKAILNLRKNRNADNRMIGVGSAQRLVADMYYQGILGSRNDIIEYYGEKQDRVKVTVKDEFDVVIRVGSFTISEFADYIINKQGYIVF